MNGTGEDVRAIRFIDVLKKKDFLLLWVGQYISIFGDRLNQLALISIIVTKSPDLAPEISRLFSFMVLPAVIFGPIAGVLVDRWDRKRTMIAADLIRAALVILIPFLTLCQSLWPIYITVFAIYALTRFFIPAKLAIIPALVKREELFVTNSVSTMATIIAMITGMALGGLIVAGVGAKIALFIDAATYLLSALFLSAMRVKVEEKGERRLKPFLEDLGRGFVYLFSQRTVYVSILVLSILMVGAGIVMVVGIAFLRREFGTGEAEAREFIKVLGIMGSLLGLGMSLGAVITGRYGHRFKKSLVFTLPLVGMGGAVLLMTLGRSLPLLGIALFAIGLFGLSIIIFINASIHRIIPKSLYGRVFSALDIVNNLSLLFSIFLAGLLASYIDERTVLQILAVTLIATGILGYLVSLTRVSKRS